MGGLGTCVHTDCALRGDPSAELNQEACDNSTVDRKPGRPTVVGKVGRHLRWPCEYASANEAP